MSVQLSHEIMTISTDILNMYVTSVNEDIYFQDLNNNNLDVNHNGDNILTSHKDDKEYDTFQSLHTPNTPTPGTPTIDTPTSTSTSTPIKTSSAPKIPISAVAAASLHWLLKLKIMYQFYSEKNKLIILKYFNIILFLCINDNNVKYHFFVSIFNNLYLIGMKWSDFDFNIKNKFIMLCKNITKIQINNKKNSKNYIADNLNDNNDKNENRNIFDDDVFRLEKLLELIKGPSIKQLSKKRSVYLEKDDMKNKKLKKYIKIEKIEKNELDLSKKEKENLKLMAKLSVKVSHLNDNDLLRVVYLLGFRRFPVAQLRVAHVDIGTYIRTHIHMYLYMKHR